MDGPTDMNILIVATGILLALCAIGVFAVIVYTIILAVA